MDITPTAKGKMPSGQPAECRRYKNSSAEAAIVPSRKKQSPSKRSSRTVLRPSTFRWDTSECGHSRSLPRRSEPRDSGRPGMNSRERFVAAKWYSGELHALLGLLRVTNQPQPWRRQSKPPLCYPSAAALEDEPGHACGPLSDL